MKLKQEKVLIKASKPKRTQQFGIRHQDMGRLLGFLRDTLYKSPITAICREVSCNARDANREAGKPNTPIEIKLPSKISPELHIIDCGPGIDPERMYDILINYGASTKLDTNDLTGGFGLGAKSPFSYTDTFSVVTVTSDGYKRHYNAIIDDTQAGRIDLNIEYKTNEPTGTKIIIPVKQEDIRSFSEIILEVTKYWKVRPKIIGNEFKDTLKPIKKIITGSNWFISKGNFLSYRFDTATILIDDIPYDVVFDDLSLDWNAGKCRKYRLLLNKDLFIEFPVGELSLAISRDNIHFDKKTKQLIIKRLDQIIKELGVIVEKEIQNCKSINEAEIKFAKFSNNIKNVLDKTPQWNNIKLQGVTRKIPSTNKNERNRVIIYGYHIGPCKLNRTTLEYYIFKENEPIFVNDSDYTTQKLAKVVRHYIESNNDVNAVLVINFTDKKIYKEWLKSEYYLKYANYNLISKLPLPPKKKRQGSYKVRKDFDAWFTEYDRLQNPIYETDIYDYTKILKDCPKGGIYILTTNPRAREFYTDKLDKISVKFLKYAAKLLNTNNTSLKDFKANKKTSQKIFIIRKKDARYLNKNWKPLDEAIIEKFESLYFNYENIDADELNKQKEFTVDNKLGLNPILKSRLIKCVSNKNSVLYKYIQSSEEVLRLYFQSKDYIEYCEQFKSLIGDSSKTKKKQIPNIEQLYKKVEQTYPLLHLIWDKHCNNYSRYSVILEDVKHYLDAVDSLNNKVIESKVSANA